MRLPLELAALACSVPVRTLRRWAADGRLTVEVSGRAYMVDLGEVAELEEARMSNGGRLTRSR